MEHIKSAQNPLILIGNRLNAAQQSRLGRQGYGPRWDFIEIARRLQADMPGAYLSPGHWMHRLEKRLKLSLLETAQAVRSGIGERSLLVSLSEKPAIPLAVLLALAGEQVPHLVIAHKLSSGLKTPFFQITGLQRSFTHLICSCRSQVDYAIGQLGMPEAKVSFIYEKVDHCFFRPQKLDGAGYILAVGQEQRDYGTLIEATHGLDIPLKIVASSPWSTSRSRVQPPTTTSLLSNVSYEELRDLYAAARLVVVPLHNVDYGAGVTALLEAMAMGKPVIVTRTVGIADYIIPGATGEFAAPADASELREQILRLWADPGEQRRLGANARQVIEEKMNLDIYIDRVVQIAHQVMLPVTT